MVDRGNSTATILTIPLNSRSSLVLKEVECFNRFVTAIVDTGSGISVISPKFCKALELERGHWEGPHIVLADGLRVFPEGVTEISVRIGEKAIRTAAAILEINGFDLLLGNDALSQLNKIQIEYCQEGPPGFFCEGEFNVIEKEGPAQRKLICREPKTIPARTGVLLMADIRVDGGLDSASKCKPRLIEPAPKLMMDKGLSVGRILLPHNAPAGPIAIYLVNFSQNDQWVNKGICLGKVEDNIEVEEPIPSLKSNLVGPLDFEPSINPQLLEDQKQAILALLSEFSDCFASTSQELGCSNLVQHEIYIGESRPIHQPPYPSA